MGKVGILYCMKNFKNWIVKLKSLEDLYNSLPLEKKIELKKKIQNDFKNNDESEYKKDIQAIFLFETSYLCKFDINEKWEENLPYSIKSSVRLIKNESIIELIESYFCPIYQDNNSIYVSKKTKKEVLKLINKLLATEIQYLMNLKNERTV